MNVITTSIIANTLHTGIFPGRYWRSIMANSSGKIGFREENCFFQFVSYQRVVKFYFSVIVHLLCTAVTVSAHELTMYLFYLLILLNVKGFME